MYFAKKNEHTVPLFVNANPLTVNFLYYESLSKLMHDVRNASAPPQLCNLFTNTSSIHSYNTRSAASNKFLRKTIKAWNTKKKLEWDTMFFEGTTATFNQKRNSNCASEYLIYLRFTTLTRNAPINVKPAEGEAGHGVGIWSS